MKQPSLLLLGVLVLFSVFPAYADTNPSPSTLKMLGQPCDPKTFTAFCDNDVIVRCIGKKVSASSCSAKEKDSICADFSDPNATPCAEGDTRCIASRRHEQAQCVPASEICQQENATETRCRSTNQGKAFVDTYTCEKTRDGRLINHVTSHAPCYRGYGYCSDSGECLPAPTCKSTYMSNCDDNIASNCVNGHLVQVNCNLINPIHTCAIMEDEAKCMPPRKACTTEGVEEIVHCNAQMNKELHSVCTKADDGSLYNVSDWRLCMNGCKADGSACNSAPCNKEGETMTICQNSKQGSMSSAKVNTYQCTKIGGQNQWVHTASAPCDNGRGTCSETGQCIAAERCDRKTFTARCEGNLAISCVQDQVRIVDCNAKPTPMTCFTTTTAAGCSKVELNCDYEGQIISNACFQSKQSDHGMTRDYVCTLDESGNLVPIYNGMGRCENGCNADKTGCAP